MSPGSIRMSGTQPCACQSARCCRYVVLDDAFASQVVRGHGPELVLVALALLLWPHPLDAVEALLKDVVWARLEVVLSHSRRRFRVVPSAFR